MYFVTNKRAIKKSWGFISWIEENNKFCRSAKNPENPQKLISAKVNPLSTKIKETAIITTLCVFCHKQEGNKQIIFNQFYIQHSMNTNKNAIPCFIVGWVLFLLLLLVKTWYNFCAEKSTFKHLQKLFKRRMRLLKHQMHAFGQPPSHLVYFMDGPLNHNHFRILYWK